MNRLKVFILLVVFVFLEALGLGVFFNNIKPNLSIILIIYLGLNCPPQEAGLYGCLAGVLEDLLSVDLFGINTLSLGLLGLVLGYLNKYLYKETTTSKILIGSLSVLIYEIAHYFILKIFYTDLIFLRALVYTILPSAIYTVVILPLIFVVLKKVLKPVARQPLFISFK
ncbi:MAG: rod shape-determining protein MreD [Candidatus Omnitrophota bacterium]